MNVFEDAVARLERLGERAGIGPEVLNALRQPQECLTASLPVRMDDGRTEYFVGHRCRYNWCWDPPRAASASTRA